MAVDALNLRVELRMDAERDCGVSHGAREWCRACKFRQGWQRIRVDELGERGRRHRTERARGEILNSNLNKI